MQDCHSSIEAGGKIGSFRISLRKLEFSVKDFGTKSVREGIFLAFFCLGTNHKSDISISTEQFSACYIPKVDRIQIRIWSFAVLRFGA